MQIALDDLRQYALCRLRHRRFICGLLFFCVMLWGSFSAGNVPLPKISARTAEGKPLKIPELENVQIGISDTLKAGNATTLNLQFKVEETYDWLVTLIVEDGDGNSIRYRKQTTLYKYLPPPHGRQTLTFDITGPRKPVKFKVLLTLHPQNRHDPKLDAHDFEAENAVLEQYAGPELPIDAEFVWIAPAEVKSIPTTKEAWLELGSSLRLKNLASGTIKEEAAQPAIVEFGSLGELRQGSNSYDGFQGIAINAELRFDSKRSLAEDQGEIQQLADWVRSGGKLLLDLHANPQKKSVSSSAQRIWNQLLPGKLTTNFVPHTQFSVWENFLGTDVPLGINEQLRRDPPLIPVLSDMKGKVLLADGETPLVIEHELGLGRVVTCLVDLNADPWRNWPKRDELLQRLIPWHITTEAETKFASSNSSLRLGYDDLAGQFVTALGTFEAVRMTPFWILMSAALGFAAIWYFLQSTLLKSWSAVARLSVAAIVLIAATLGFAMLTGGISTTERLLSKTAQVVDYNAAQGEYQGQAWLSLMSSNPRQVDLQTSVHLSGIDKTDTTANVSQQLEWLGMPGKGWGGLDAPLATWTQSGEAYQIDSHNAAVQGLTLSPDLTKSFHERWNVPTLVKATTPLVSHHGESLPRGTLKSELPFPLKDAILLYDTWGVELGTVQPGQVIDLEQIRGRVASAGTIITGKRAQPTAPVQSYDRANADVPQILRLLLLHRAAGGTRYTGLFSRAWPLLDQSGSLTENQALILGVGPGPVQWTVAATDGTPADLQSGSDVCFYRLWLPVVPNESATESTNAPTVIRLPASK